MEKTLLCFHHTDLDGMGVKLLAKISQYHNQFPLRTFKCGYSRINNMLYKETSDMDNFRILIGDISVDLENAKLLDLYYNSGIEVKLYDHHETAEFLNKYPWAKVKEVDDNNISRCGTYWVSQDKEFLSYYEAIEDFVKLVDDYDTWKWDKNGNTLARDLNSLYVVLGEDEFVESLLTKYILNGKLTYNTIFDELSVTRVNTYNRLVEHQVYSCERNMYKCTFWIGNSSTTFFSYNVGVIFCNSYISDVSNQILDLHPELDILMIVTYPFSISWRTKKDLRVSLGQLAKLATGQGGGHPKAAASRIPFKHFEEHFVSFFEKLMSDNLEITGFTYLNL